MNPQPCARSLCARAPRPSAARPLPRSGPVLLQFCDGRVSVGAARAGHAEAVRLRGGGAAQQACPARPAASASATHRPSPLGHRHLSRALCPSVSSAERGGTKLSAYSPDDPRAQAAARKVQALARGRMVRRAARKASVVGQLAQAASGGALVSRTDSDSTGPAVVGKSCPAGPATRIAPFAPLPPL